MYVPKSHLWSQLLLHVGVHVAQVIHQAQLLTLAPCESLTYAASEAHNQGSRVCVSGPHHLATVLHSYFARGSREKEMKCTGQPHGRTSV